MTDVRCYNQYEVTRLIKTPVVTLVPGGDPIWIDFARNPIQFSPDGGVSWESTGHTGTTFTTLLRDEALVPVTTHYLVTRDTVLLEGQRIIPKRTIVALKPTSPGWVLVTLADGTKYSTEGMKVREALAKGILMPHKPAEPAPKPATAEMVVRSLQRRPELLAEVASLLHNFIVVGPWEKDFNVLVRRRHDVPGRPVALQIIAPGERGPYEWSVKLPQGHASSEEATIEAAKEAADTYLQNMQAIWNKDTLTVIFLEEP
jgi:hypothetical protein